MKLSIITPSFRQPGWLRLCMASVADQTGLEVEHIVQDNESGAEVATVAHAFPKARLMVEKDGGMYDAVNRGLRRATGEICAYLNCDEQYLPGALETVHHYFDSHPETEVLFADAVVADADGSYICSRQVLNPLRYHTQVCHLNTYTAATFFRRSILERHSLYFDTRWRAAGDAVWVLEMIRRKVHMGILRQYVAVFTDTGENLNMNEAGQKEVTALRDQAPTWAVQLAPLWVLHHRLRRLANGLYRPAPFSYGIYTRAHPDARSNFRVNTPVAVWRDRLSWSR